MKLHLSVFFSPFLQTLVLAYLCGKIFGNKGLVLIRTMLVTSFLKHSLRGVSETD